MKRPLLPLFALLLAAAISGAHAADPLVPTFKIRHVRAGGNFLWGITTGTHGLVAVGAGGTILTSENGEVWTRRDAGSTDWLVGVAYGAGQYVAVGDRGRVLVSTDGKTWANIAHGVTSARLNNVIYAGNKFVAVGEAGTIITSPDARTWAARNTGITGWLRGLAYEPTRESQSPGYTNSFTSQYFAAGQGGVLMTSRDGDVWFRTIVRGNLFTPGVVLTKDIEAMTSRPLAGIGADGTLFAVFRFTDVSKTPIALPGGGLYTDVRSWVDWGIYSIGINAKFRGMTQAANELFAVGENGIIALNRSGPAEWVQIDSGTTASLTGGVYAGNSLFVVGENETVLQSTPFYYSRLLNISSRGNVGTGEGVLISGIVVTGSAPKKMLVRAIGPGLAGFGVAGALSNPVLAVHDSDGRVVATNTGWGTHADPAAMVRAAAQTGAFPLQAGSADSALLATLDPGRYTIQVAGLDGSTGVALAEIYDADGLATETSRAVNISTRGMVGPDQPALIAGFNIGGMASRRVLVRAVGPSLSAFGVGGALAEPRVVIYESSGGHYSYFEPDGTFTIMDSTAFARTSSWSTRANADQVRGAAYLAGAFPLLEDSNDAVLVGTLKPGSYTAVVSGLNNSSGVALIEVYDLP